MCVIATTNWIVMLCDVRAGTREAEERKDFERKKMISAEIYTRLKRTEDAMLSQISTNMQLLSQLVQLWGINSTCTEHEMPEDLVCQVNIILYLLLYFSSRPCFIENVYFLTK